MLNISYLHFLVSKDQVQLRWHVIPSPSSWLFNVLVKETVLYGLDELSLLALCSMDGSPRFPVDIFVIEIPNYAAMGVLLFRIFFQEQIQVIIVGI